MSDPLRCFDPAHRSYSSDKEWDHCQTLAALVDAGEVVKSFPAKVARGSTVDDAVMALIDGRDPIDFAGTYRGYCTEYLVAFPDEAKQVEAGLAQVALFEREVLPTLGQVSARSRRVHQTQMEVHWTLDDIEYHAHLDISMADGFIWDVKAPDQRLGARRADDDPQLTTYAAALYGAFGHLAPGVGYLGLVNSRTPEDIEPVAKLRTKPWLDRQTSVRTLEQIATWEAEARRREASRRWARSTGIYQTQARSSPYGCSGCDAKRLCPAWAGFDLGAEAA